MLGATIVLLATTTAADASTSADAVGSPAPAAQVAPIDLSAGTSGLVVLGPLSSHASLSLDVAAHGPLRPALGWTLGARLPTSPVVPESFARISVEPALGAWLPAAGLELGLSPRAHQDSGDALLAGARAMSRDGLSPIYVALHSTPLRFAIGDRLRVSVLELQLGSHVAPLGRYVRLQLGIVSAGMTL